MAARLLAALALAAASLVAPGAAAEASCVQMTLAERAASAQVVAYGTVTETRQTFAPASGVTRFRPERVLKGSLSGEIEVSLGPTHGGPPTSVDYTAAVRGEAHTLYLRALPGGAFETSACAGSHSGAPTPEETAFFGAGTVVGGGSTDSGSPVTTAVLLAVLTLAALTLGLAFRARQARLQIAR